MKLAIITLTKQGLRTARRIAFLYKGEAHIYTPLALLEEVSSKDAALKLEEEGVIFPLKQPLKYFCGQLWKSYQGLIFIMATGIVVRCLAPYLQDKKKDPAVVVLDEKGEYVISLLSGHLGGANRLAREIAHFLGGKAVITTSSDIQGLPALDVVAKELGFKVTPEGRFAQVMGALVNGKRVGIWAEEPWQERLEKELKGLKVEPWSKYRGPEGWEAGILVTSRREKLPPGPWVFWRPQELVAGVGCRKGIDYKSILRALGVAFKTAGRSLLSLKALATLEFKAKEEGLVIVARKFNVPLLSFSKEELLKVWEETPGLSYSPLAQEKIGLGGVCEPAALLGARKGELICKKIALNGVTVALARATYL